MPTNANTFNSRVTSEALEAKFRQVFPAQGGAELVQDLFASGVIQPVIDFSSVAEGTFLAQNLQTAWDFATERYQAQGATTNMTSTPGFYRVAWSAEMLPGGGAADVARVQLFDGTTTKVISEVFANTSTATYANVYEGDFVVFVRTGDSLNITTNQPSATITATIRQIADLYGNLTNPLGYVPQ